MNWKAYSLNTMRNQRLQWAGHAMRSQNSIIKRAMDLNPVGKTPLWRP